MTFLSEMFVDMPACGLAGKGNGNIVPYYICGVFFFDIMSELVFRSVIWDTKQHQKNVCNP